MSPFLEALSSAWVPDLLLGCLTMYLRIRSGSWLAPSSFLGMYWFGFLTASLLAMDHRVPALGIWVLVSLIVTVQTGSTITETTPTSPRSARELELQDMVRRRITTACMLLMLIAIAASIFFVWLTLKLFDEEFTYATMLQMAAKWTFLRYGEFSDPWSIRWAAVWVYPVALLGGMLVALTTTWREKLLGFATLLPSLLLSLLAGARAGFILGLGCWLGGHWAVRVACSDGPPWLFKRKTAVSFVGLALGLLLLYVGVNALRGGRDVSYASDLSITFNSGQIRNYMFGTPAAFAEWFDRGERGPLMWGALTLQGVYDALHIRRKTLGTYNDSERTVGLEGTNIFTMFRGLIQDFSLPGAYFVCALWGVLSGHAYARRSLDTGPALALAAFYTVSLFGGLMCPFAFNSTIFTWVVAWLGMRRGCEQPSSCRSAAVANA